MDVQLRSRSIRVTKYQVTMVVIFIFVTSAVLSYGSWWNLMNKVPDKMSTHLSNFMKNKPTYKQDELERVLDSASMGNKTVMLSVLNRAYANKDGMFDLFLESFRNGKNTSHLLNHLLIICFDQIAYDRCISLHPHCYKVFVEGNDFSKELLFMSKGYLNMLWRKTSFLIEILKKDYSFFFTDMDILWFRNPLEMLKGNKYDDIQFSCDSYTGHPYDLKNGANIGFYLIRSNNKTIALFEKLYGMRNHTGGKKQQDLLRDFKFQGVFKQLGLKIRYLDPLYIAGFCSNPGTFNQVMTMHANCCRTIKAKLEDLRFFLDKWKRFSNNTIADPIFPPHKACLHSW